jgi:hypothetical protein
VSLVNPAQAADIKKLQAKLRLPRGIDRPDVAALGTVVPSASAIAARQAGTRPSAPAVPARPWAIRPSAPAGRRGYAGRGRSGAPRSRRAN